MDPNKTPDIALPPLNVDTTPIVSEPTSAPAAGPPQAPPDAPLSFAPPPAPVPTPEPIIETPAAPPTASPTAAKTPAKKFQTPNIMLVAGICTFIMSVAFYAQTQQAIYTSQASQLPQTEAEVVPPTSAPPSVTPASTAPKAYKGEDIPQILYTSASAAVPPTQANKDVYIQSMIMKYYVYEDLFADEKIDFETKTPEDFTALTQSVTEMEKELSTTLLSKADFGYITAHVGNAPNLATKLAARTLLEGYRKSLTEKKYTIEQMVDIAAADETLITLGKGKVGGILKDYDSTRALFPQTAEFDEFLFDQEADTPSTVYSLKDLQGKEYAIVLLYPTRIVTNKYNSLYKILETYKKNFSY